MGPELQRIVSHYAPPDLTRIILQALAVAGKDPARLSPEDLAPIDEFHIRGRLATKELARQVCLGPGKQVLDVGCGLGGASRYLALEFDCRVTGIDLTGEYCRVANLLASGLGLQERVAFCQGNALALPFADDTFDLLWTQHAAMNIADKNRLYREMWRVLKPGGELAVYDILAGTGGAVYFPVPWARDPRCSFLISPQQLRECLESSGFKIQSWRDATETGRQWFVRLAENTQGHLPAPIGLHLLLGPDFREMAQNMVRNLQEERICLIEAILRRP